MLNPIEIPSPKKDEIYRKKAKQKTIQTLLKKKNISNELLKNTTGAIDDDNVDIDFKIKVTDENDGGSDDDVVYVNYVPPPPENPSPLIHPRERLKQRIKEIR